MKIENFEYNNVKYVIEKFKESNYNRIIIKQKKYNEEITFIISRNDLLKNYNKIQELFLFFKKSNSDLLLLVPNKNAPKEGVRNDGNVESLIYKSDKYEFDLNKMKADKLCFFILKEILDDPKSNGILVKSFDENLKCLSKQSKDNEIINSTTTVIPHQGDLNHLKSCLHHINQNISCSKNINIYFDEIISKKHIEIINSFNYFNFYKISPTNQGPYVSRNHSALNNQRDYLIFQDSDDIPTRDRYYEISQEIKEQPHIDLFGCHELRFDEIDEKVKIIRFPIDVNKALDIKASHPLFHPTSTIKNSAFKRTGYFSTNRRFGADTQYLLRAYFYLSIKNINKFLYIRRRRKNSLTTSEKTKLKSPIRIELDRIWKSDFDSIKNKKMLISQSSIKEEITKVNYKIEKIHTRVI